MALKSTHPCFCAYNRTMDLKTPRNARLSAFYRRSFAFRTVRDRLPVILTKVIDNIAQNKVELIETYGTEALEDIKQVIARISRLKYEIQTNKPLKPFKLFSDDGNIYNECILNATGQEGVPTPFHTKWLLVECYMYRKIREAIEKTAFMKHFDPFLFSKQELFENSLPHIKNTLNFAYEIIQSTTVATKEDFSTILQLNLWSNKCDLSFNVDGVEGVPVTELKNMYEKILIDDSEKVWTALRTSQLEIVDFILDNVSTDLIGDFVVAEYLISKDLCKKVVFHSKRFPWFVSDATTFDVKWTLEAMCKYYEDNLVHLSGENWSRYMDSGQWEIKTSRFWTLPLEFEQMHKYARNLYSHFQKSRVIFVKGDLNYRKLFKDVYYDPETKIEKAQGYFAPSCLCILRTIKSEVICGLNKNLAQKCESMDKKWMESGEFGVIQFTDKRVPLFREEDLKKISSDTTIIDDNEPEHLVTFEKCLCRN